VTTFNIHTVLKIGDAIEAKVKKAVEDELARLLTDLEGVVEHVESQIVSDSGVTPVSPTPPPAPPAPVEPTPAPEPAPEAPVEEPAPVVETTVDPTPAPTDGADVSPPPDSSTDSETPPA
jgi:hypothetical protein